MYDKSGLVLRVETVINNPEEFRVRKQVLRKGKPQTEWVAMRKGVSPTIPLSRGLAPSQRPLSGRAGHCRGSNQRETRSGSGHHAKKGSGWASLPCLQSACTSRRRTIPKHHGRRALPARFHQSRHPRTA
jgi:hypothetical protein